DPGKSQGGFLNLGVKDKSLSKPQLESSEGSLWPALAPSMAGLPQRNHRGIFCPRGWGSSFCEIDNSPRDYIPNEEL
ncbi:hypothetical protein FQN60_004031, partial [Etheostoma spectabile]